MSFKQQCASPPDTTPGNALIAGPGVLLTTLLATILVLFLVGVLVYKPLSHRSLYYYVQSLAEFQIGASAIVQILLIALRESLVLYHLWLWYCMSLVFSATYDTTVFVSTRLNKPESSCALTISRSIAGTVNTTMHIAIGAFTYRATMSGSLSSTSPYWCHVIYPEANDLLSQQFRGPFVLCLIGLKTILWITTTIYMFRQRRHAEEEEKGAFTIKVIGLILASMLMTMSGLGIGLTAQYFQHENTIVKLSDNTEENFAGNQWYGVAALIYSLICNTGVIGTIRHKFWSRSPTSNEATGQSDTEQGIEDTAPESKRIYNSQPDIPLAPIPAPTALESAHNPLSQNRATNLNPELPSTST